MSSKCFLSGYKSVGPSVQEKKQKKKKKKNKIVATAAVLNILSERFLAIFDLQLI